MTTATTRRRKPALKLDPTSPHPIYDAIADQHPGDAPDTTLAYGDIVLELLHEPEPEPVGETEAEFLGNPPAIFPIFVAPAADEIGDLFDVVDLPRLVEPAPLADPALREGSAA